jgi:hypothetical protein
VKTIRLVRAGELPVNPRCVTAPLILWRRMNPSAKPTDLAAIADITVGTAEGLIAAADRCIAEGKDERD